MVRVIAKHAVKRKYDHGLTGNVLSQEQTIRLRSVLLDKLDAEFPVVPPADLRFPRGVFRQDGQIETGRHGDVITKAQLGAGLCEISDFAIYTPLLAHINNQALLVYFLPRLSAVIFIITQIDLRLNIRFRVIDSRDISLFAGRIGEA